MPRRPSSASLFRDPDGSALRFTEEIERLVAAFGAAVAPLLRAKVGQSEANLTSAVETLLREAANLLGLNLLAHREASHQSLGVRPDLAIDVAGSRTGVIELKAPGMGVPGTPGWGKARDRKQWERLKALPNVLYTDGSSWALYNFGEEYARATLDGDLALAGTRLRPADSAFASLLKSFLYWEPSPPRDLRELIKISAGLCHLLREEVAEALERERTSRAGALFSSHLADWQEWLFPDLTDAEFVDAYAQTITFGLLLARREGVIFEGLEIPDIGERLAKRNLLMGRALSILTTRRDRGPSIEERSTVLQTMRRVIGAADWSQWPTAGTYHWMYEDFLESYDPVIRRGTGAYYTPTPVTDCMTGLVDEVLRKRLHIHRGLADPNVVILDPAMGTGTFLQSVVDIVANVTTQEGGDTPASLRDLLTRLIGFERQIGPYAVAELKMDQALETYSAEAKDEDFRLYVADTLDDPRKVPLPQRPYMYAPLADSRLAANAVKTDEDVMVVIGNPPYKANAKRHGKWILERRPGRESLLDDFRFPGTGRHQSKLHDLAIYFWRWALWKAFESTPDYPSGIVAFITTNAYLTGPAFAGMRRYLRQQTDFGWILELSPEGHRSDVSTRVFPGVPHPVCIGIFARGRTPHLDLPADIHYRAIYGSQQEKFDRLASIHIDDEAWQRCPNDWIDPMQPSQPIAWTRHPSIDSLLPYMSLGVTCNRAWVHSPDPEVLTKRWRALVAADPEEKRRLMKETRDRTIDMRIPVLPGEPKSSSIHDEHSADPRIKRITFRSFDRHYLIADQRVVDFLRTDLWAVDSPHQVYLVTQIREPLSGGPGAIFTACVPDVDCFKGRGGRAIPLFRDGACKQVNAAPGLIEFIGRCLGLPVRNEDLMAYIAGIIGHSGYTALFKKELRQPGVRIPLTAVPELWLKAVSLGKNVIWIHTFGERFGNAADSFHIQLASVRPSVLEPISGRVNEAPESVEYEPSTRCLLLGTGRLGPVSLQAWHYQVSGMGVIKHWFGYRKRHPSGRRGGSDLDEIVANRWTMALTEELRDLVAVVERCVALEEEQAALLCEVVSNELVTTGMLEEANLIPPPNYSRQAALAEDDVVLF